MVAALNLAAMTTVAHAQATDEPTGKQALRPPTQSQVGEAWRQPKVAPAVAEVAGDVRRPPTESQVGEPWRHRTQVPARPAEPGGRPGWRLASLGFLAAALALAGGLAVHAATRPGRSTRGRAGGLIRVAVTPLDGLPRPPAAHRLAGDGLSAYVAVGAW
jgi:hypothetical protein